MTPEKGCGLDDVVTIIDYAHNAVSMRAAIETLRKYQPKRIVVLFGSVGGRTQLRRAELGETAGQLADFCIITSDNPNFEPPDDIISDIEKSVAATSCPYVTFVDRRRQSDTRLITRSPAMPAYSSPARGMRNIS